MEEYAIIAIGNSPQVFIDDSVVLKKKEESINKINSLKSYLEIINPLFFDKDV